MARTVCSACFFLIANHVAWINAGPTVLALHSHFASVNGYAAIILVLHICFEGGSPAVSEAGINVCNVRHSYKDDIDTIHSNWRHSQGLVKKLMEDHVVPNQFNVCHRKLLPKSIAHLFLHFAERGFPGTC